jgi:hypothetical protein
MLSIMQRPSVDYTKDDILRAFSTLAGSSQSYGVINTDTLNRAIQYGNGGISKHEAEDLMAMLEHAPTATLDYVELCDLLMGHKMETQGGNNTEQTKQMMAKVRQSAHSKQPIVSFMVPKHILDLNRGPTSAGSSSGQGAVTTTDRPSESQKKQKKHHTARSKEHSGGGHGTTTSTTRIQTKKSKSNLKKAKQQQHNHHHHENPQQQQGLSLPPL